MQMINNLNSLNYPRKITAMKLILYLYIVINSIRAVY